MYAYFSIFCFVFLLLFVSSLWCLFFLCLFSTCIYMNSNSELYKFKEQRRIYITVTSSINKNACQKDKDKKNIWYSVENFCKRDLMYVLRLITYRLLGICLCLCTTNVWIEWTETTMENSISTSFSHSN